LVRCPLVRQMRPQLSSIDGDDDGEDDSDGDDDDDDDDSDDDDDDYDSDDDDDDNSGALLAGLSLQQMHVMLVCLLHECCV
jgi:hypothetical protein